MKVRITRKLLADMPDQVRALVIDWKLKHHKAFISVNTVTEFNSQEDSRVTMINIAANSYTSVRVAGEFAGATPLSPVSKIPVPEGCAAVVTGFFLGHPWLTVYQGGKPQLPPAVPTSYTVSGDAKGEVKTVSELVDFLNDITTVNNDTGFYTRLCADAASTRTPQKLSLGVGVGTDMEDSVELTVTANFTPTASGVL